MFQLEVIVFLSLNRFHNHLVKGLATKEGETDLNGV